MLYLSSQKQNEYCFEGCLLELNWPATSPRPADHQGRREVRDLFIHEAAKLAVAVDGLIVRPPWKGLVHIKPTNGPECCICYGKGKAPGPRWNPQAEDLLADDWEVTTEKLT